jgi:hypothetical protein
MGVSLGRASNGRIELLGSEFKLCVKGAGAVWGSTTVGYGLGLSESSLCHADTVGPGCLDLKLAESVLVHSGS